MKLYAALLRLFPRAFRSRYGRDMTEVFSDRWRAARRRGTLPAVWLAIRTIADLSVHAAAERRARTVAADHLARDLRLAFRGFARRPGFTAVALLTVALGVSANAAIFSVVRPLLLDQLPFPDPDRIVNVYEVPRDRPDDTSVANPANFDAWEKRLDLFTAIAGFSGASGTLTGAGEPERLRMTAATPSLLDVFGVRPTLGRTFTQAEADAGARMIVLSDTLWRSRFGADPGILGRGMTLDGRRWEIVGVMPREFEVPHKVSAWVPFALTPALRQNHNTWFLSVVGRLAPGISIEAARTGLDASMRQLAAAVPGFNARASVKVIGRKDDAVSGVRRELWILQAVALVVLLIACANLANLLLAQTAGRTREFAIRTAVGASARQILRQLLIEGIVLAGAGGLIGAGLAAWAVPVMISIAPSWSWLPQTQQLSVGWREVAAAVALALAVGGVFSALPAAMAARAQQGPGAGPARGSTAGRRQQRTRSILVASQVALALVLLAGAGLLVRSFTRLTAQPIGFAADDILTAELSLPPATYDTDEKRRQLFSTLIDGLASHPGVMSATASTALPFTWWEWMDQFTVLNRPQRPQITAAYRVITPSYFSTLDVPIVRGRGLSAADAGNAPHVAIVNEAFARKHAAMGDAIGLALMREDGDHTKPITIVGVAGDTRHRSFERPPQAEVFLPLAQSGPISMTLAVRGRGNPATRAAVIRRALDDLDPDLPLADVKPLSAWVGAAVAERRFYMLLLVVLAGLAASLAAVGIYGVTAYVVRLRTREIGIRLALGASAGGVEALMIRQGMTPVVIGAAIGMGTALAATRILQNQLFQIDPRDPLTMACSAAAFMAVAGAACWIPSRRTSRIDPTEVLLSDG